jgi:large exoprotein involved in heme utilization and adhesion
MNLQAHSLTVADGAVLQNATIGPGATGNIAITADNVILSGTNSDGSVPGGVFAQSSGTGIAGNITLQSKTLTVTGGAQLGSVVAGPGTVGTVTITADNIILQGSSVDGTFPSGLFADAIAGSGPSGSLIIQAQTFTVADGAQVSTSTHGSGVGGSISVTADTVTVRGFSKGLQSGLLANSLSTDPGAGPAGDLTIQAHTLTVVDGGLLESTTKGPGTGGTIEITATTVTLQGTGVNGIAETGIFAQSRSTNAGAGSAGNLTIRAETLTALDGAEVSTSTLGPGKGGTVTAQITGALTLSGAGTQVSTASTGNGSGGNIHLSAGQLQMMDQAVIRASSSGPGNAGTISLVSAQDITLTDSTVQTSAVQASGGNIKLTAPGTVMLDSSKLTSSVNGPTGSNGGNIVIDPVFVILRNGSQVLAQANEGAGGNILINATGAVLAEAGTLIDASAASGINGSINIQAPIRALSGAIAPLPQAFAKITNLYRQHCAAQKGGQFSSFVQGTRDGLPPQPGDALGSPLTFESMGNASSRLQSSDLAAARLGFNIDGLNTENRSSVTGCRS